MPPWIEHPSNPQALILAWQAPSAVTDRVRWAVGRLERTPDGAMFDYLDPETFKALNLGRSLDELRAAGFAGYPAFDLRNRPSGGFVDNALQAFMRRLPPASRSDYGDYLATFRLRPSTTISPMGLLAATEARLPGDGFSLIDPLSPSVETLEVLVEIAGYRHRALQQSPAIGDELVLRPEPDNPKDPGAVQVLAGGNHLGYVNRLQAATVRAWLSDRDLEAWIVRVNGSATSPRIFAFLQVRPLTTTEAA